ncbi:MAG: aminoacyl-tRNA hydrolase, partial [Solirubrobacteraceae bacterium]
MPRAGPRHPPRMARPTRLPARAASEGPRLPVDWLIVGLGNPGAEYAGTPHNIGFEVVERLRARWGLSRPKARYRGLLSEGRAPIPTHPRVAILLPQTYMNDAGRSVGPARGELRVEPERILVVHDEIDLPFGEVRARLGGGLAGHNGLKSVRAALGSPDFRRLRIGVGRPPTTDPERVIAHVLGRFREPREAVQELIERAADAAEQVIAESAEGAPGDS